MGAISTTRTLDGCHEESSMSIAFFYIFLEASGSV